MTKEMRIKSKRGITLITLIITIVILLILSMVSIDVIVDNSIYDEANKVVQDIENQDATIQGIKDEVRDLVRP